MKQSTDFDIQSAVLAELASDQRVAPQDIGIAVRDGVVTLTGEVQSLAQRSAAAKAAERVNGVKSIANEIIVRLPIDQRRTDADIADDVVNALIWDTEVPDKTIKARVQDRWVWLLGEAEWQYQRMAAEEAVQNIAGVKGVTNLVRLKRRAAPPDIKTLIERALERNVTLMAREISVTVNEGSVTLSGVVRSCRERDEATGAAWSAPGVAKVDNRLEIAGVNDDHQNPFVETSTGTDR